MGVIASRTDRVMVMYAGKIVEGAGTRELFDTIRHPYSEALFESIPRLDQDRERRLYSIPGVPPDLSTELVGCRFAPRCQYATEVCTELEPVLSAGPGATTPLSALGGLTDGSGSEHVFACHHPVAATRAERLAFHQGGDLALSGGAARSGPLHDVSAEREVLLQVSRLEKEYSVTAGAVVQRKVGTVKAVSDVSFSLRRGETLGLVGESGCGKTTIGRLVVGLERPSGGAVHFEGEEVSALKGARLRRRRRDLQLMFQDPYSSLDPRMRVGSIVGEPLRIQHLGTRGGQEQRVSEVLAEVGLPAKAANLYPHEFSGGQRQRIGLARALVLHPKLIVADEPVSALDVSIQAQILNLVRSLQERHDLTLIVISHDLAVLKYLADTIGVMYLGKLVEIGPAEDVYAHAAHPYTRGLIDTIPVPDPEFARLHRSTPVKGELPSSISPPTGCRFRTRCPLAQAICAEEEPPLRPFGTGHHAACHFPLQVPLRDDQTAHSAATSA
jgi:oligopeptide/dipeptide ABC transporter ATP-binding protein